jgi:hypothetical protein
LDQAKALCQNYGYAWPDTLSKTNPNSWIKIDLVTKKVSVVSNLRGADNKSFTAVDLSGVIPHLNKAPVDYALNAPVAPVPAPLPPPPAPKTSIPATPRPAAVVPAKQPVKAPVKAPVKPTTPVAPVGKPPVKPPVVPPNTVKQTPPTPIKPQQKAKGDGLTLTVPTY